MNKVYVPVGGAKRLPIQACSRMPDPYRGLPFQKGVYHDVEPIRLAGTCLFETVSRLPNFDRRMINGVIMTCANPTGPQNMTGRTIVNWLTKTYHENWTHVWGNSVNQLCMSGLRGQLDAANMLVSPFTRSGKPMVIVVVGVEKMTECRLEDIFSIDYSAEAIGALGAERTAMGYTAEMTASRYGVTKEMCDALALAENRGYRKAIQEGWFKDEIVPIVVDLTLIDEDAAAEPLTPEIMAANEKFFFRSPKKGAVLTQYSSSQMSDGAAVIVLCNEAALEEYGWEPMAQFIGGSISTVPAEVMGEGLIAAFDDFLTFTGLEMHDFLEMYGLFEFNTAFASIPLALAKKHELDLEKINVAGGATTPLGHPLGATGVRLVVTLLHLMQRFNVDYGYAGACVGEGQGGGCGYQNLQV